LLRAYRGLPFLLSLEGADSFESIRDSAPQVPVMDEAWFDFSLLTDAGFRLLRYAPGDRIFVQDDEGSCLYVVRSGKVNITTYGTVLESVGPNGVFGEMALIDGSPRSATAIAAEASEVAPIDQAAFTHLVRHDPEFALRVMRILAGRIRQMNASL
jgi:CRP/FNR family transcriptional regulator, cyclic AMP receptor protein